MKSKSRFALARKAASFPRTQKKFSTTMQPTNFFASDQAPKGLILLQAFLHRAISAELKSGLDAIKYLYHNCSISKGFAFELAIYCLCRVGRGKGFCAMHISEIITKKESVNA